MLFLMSYSWPVTKCLVSRASPSYARDYIMSGMLLKKTRPAKSEKQKNYLVWPYFYLSSSQVGWSALRHDQGLLPGAQCRFAKQRLPLVVSCTASSGNQDVAAGRSSSLEFSGIRVERNDRCVVIRMERGENRLNREFVGAMNQALDAA